MATSYIKFRGYCPTYFLNKCLRGRTEYAPFFLATAAGSPISSDSCIDIYAIITGVVSISSKIPRFNFYFSSVHITMSRSCFILRHFFLTSLRSPKKSTARVDVLASCNQDCHLTPPSATSLALAMRSEMKWLCSFASPNIFWNHASSYIHKKFWSDRASLSASCWEPWLRHSPLSHFTDHSIILLHIDHFTTSHILLSLIDAVRLFHIIPSLSQIYSKLRSPPFQCFIDQDIMDASSSLSAF